MSTVRRSSVPKRHHYNPEMLSRRFCDANGRIHFYDKRIRFSGVKTSTPQNVFVIGHLYSAINSDDTKDPSLEHYFSRIEGIANRLIDKIVAAARLGRHPLLKPSEKWVWDRYFYHQWSRVPEVFQPALVDFENLLGHTIKDFENDIRPLTSEERQNLSDPKTIDRLRQNALVKSLSNPFGEALKIISSKGLGIAIIKNNRKSFVIGTIPIVKLTPRDTAHLADPRVEAWLPISHDVAVTPYGAQGTETLALAEDPNIRKINEAIFHQSDVIAGRSKALITSLTRHARDPKTQ